MMLRLGLVVSLVALCGCAFFRSASKPVLPTAAPGYVCCIFEGQPLCMQTERYRELFQEREGECPIVFDGGPP